MAGGATWAGGIAIGDDESSRAPRIGIGRTPVAPLPRAQHATVALAGGLVLCIGGVSPAGTLASCQVYDPGLDEWYDAAPLARPRSWHSATPLEDVHRRLQRRSPRRRRAVRPERPAGRRSTWRSS